MKKKLNGIEYGLIILLLVAAGCNRSPEGKGAAGTNLGPTLKPAMVDGGERYLGEGFGLLAPQGWSNMTKLATGKRKLYMAKEGLSKELKDETGAPLQAGLTVEVHPNITDSLMRGMETWKAVLKANTRFTIVGDQTLEPYKLNDGREALLLTSEILKSDERRSLQFRLLAKDDQTNGWVVTGFIVGGKESTFPKTSSPLARKVRAHVTSFCIDPTKLAVPK